MCDSSGLGVDPRPFPRIHGMAKNKADLDDIVMTSLEKAGLIKEVKDRLNDSGTGLSGDQQQRSPGDLFFGFVSDTVSRTIRWPDF